MELLQSRETHELRFGPQRVVLDVERTRLFEIDGLSSRILAALRDRPASEGELVGRLGDGHPAEEVREALRELRELALVTGTGGAPGDRPEEPRPGGVRTLCLHVIHDCNLRCLYCYGRGGTYGTPKQSMSFATAARAVDFLLDGLPPGGRGRIIFFGGEPLLAWGLLRGLIPWIRRREEEAGKRIELSLTTNGTLLGEPRVRFLAEHRVQVNVSLDGPPATHDAWRVFADGSGSYERVRAGVRRLFAVQPRRTLRATLDPADPRLLEVVDHLTSLGADLVHAEPASDLLGEADGGLSPEAVERLKGEYRRLKERCLEALRTGSRIPPVLTFVRYLRLLTRPGPPRLYGCGLGRAYVAVTPGGEIYPCHRFAGRSEYRMGDLESGIPQATRERYLALDVHRREPCRTCWARHLCGGGCSYEAALTQGGLERPDPGHCELTREAITAAIEIAASLGRTESRQALGLAVRDGAVEDPC